MNIIPVIHHIDEKTTFENVKICSNNNVYGIFLIQMDGKNETLTNLAKKIKLEFESLKVGVNHLGYYAKESVLECINYGLDMCWSDNSIVSSEHISNEALEIQKEIKNMDFKFFNSVAFKYQKKEPNPPLAAIKSKSLGFIPTTSGVATGVFADLNKIKAIKNDLKEYPLALASGLNVDNVKDFQPYINFGLVSTGISEDFHHFSNKKLKELMLNLK